MITDQVIEREKEYIFNRRLIHFSHEIISLMYFTDEHISFETSIDLETIYLSFWIIEARRLANEIALEMWNSGMQEITARKISGKVANCLGKNSDYWGTKGPRSSGNIRNIALVGWRFIPPQS